MEKYFNYSSLVSIAVTAILVLILMPHGFYEWFLDTNEAKAALITGIFTLLSALAAIAAACIAYRSSHMTIKDQEDRAFCMFSSFVRAACIDQWALYEMLDDMDKNSVGDSELYKKSRKEYAHSLYILANNNAFSDDVILKTSKERIDDAYRMKYSWMSAKEGVKLVLVCEIDGKGLLGVEIQKFLISSAKGRTENFLQQASKFFTKYNISDSGALEGYRKIVSSRNLS